MGFSEVDRLAIAQLVFYVPAFIASLWVSQKHGWGRHTGWVFLALFTLVRIVGSSLQLAADQSPNKGLYIGTYICQNIGLSPLLLTMLGMLKRVRDGMFKSILPVRLFNLQYIVLLAAFVMAIIAGAQSGSQHVDRLQRTHTFSEVAVTMFLGSLLCLSTIAAVLFYTRRDVPREELHLLTAAIAAVPLLLVRLTYAMIAAWDHKAKDFEILTGRLIVRVVMVVIEEFAVVLIFLTAALLTPKIPRANVQRGGAAQALAVNGVESHELASNGAGTHEVGGFGAVQSHGRRRGPIGMLIGLAKNRRTTTVAGKHGQTVGVVERVPDRTELDAGDGQAQHGGAQETGAVEVA